MGEEKEQGLESWMLSLGRITPSYVSGFSMRCQQTSYCTYLMMLENGWRPDDVTVPDMIWFSLSKLGLDKIILH